MGPLITYREVVPWKVATRYADTAVMHHLRTMAQLQKGMEVPAVAKRRLHEWLQYLENNRLVVAGQDVDDDAAARAKDVQC